MKPILAATWVDDLAKKLWEECNPIEYSPKGTYFAKSNGRRNLYFVRASRLMQFEAAQYFLARQILAASSELLTPSQVNCINVDTTAILGLGTALATLIARQHDVNNGPSISVRSFQSYRGVRELKLDEVDCELILISASSSSGLATQIRNESGIAAKRMLTLVGDSTAINRFPRPIFDLQEDNEYTKTRELERTALFAELTAIPVDDAEFNFGPDEGRTIVLSVAHGESRWRPSDPAVSKLSDATASLGWQTLAFLRETADRSRTRRPLSIGVSDVLKKNGSYAQSAIDFVRREAKLHSKNLVLIAEERHEDIEAFKRSLAAMESDSLRVVGYRDDGAFTPLPDHVMVLAPMIATGYILEDVSRTIRERAPGATRAFWIGLWASNTRARADTLQRTICHSGNARAYPLEVLAKVAIGNSLAGVTGSNVWSRETTLLQRQNLRKHFELRLIGLNKPTNDSVVWRYGQQSPLKLGPTFAFWPNELSSSSQAHSQVDVLLTIAGVLQVARERTLNAEGSLRPTAYQHRVLSAENFFRFNEPLIHGCLLRCAEPHEIDYSHMVNESGAIRAYIVSMLDAPESARAESLYEFLLAFALKRLKLNDTDIKKITEAAEEIEWAAALLRSIHESR